MLKRLLKRVDALLTGTTGLVVGFGLLALGWLVFALLVIQLGGR